MAINIGFIWHGTSIVHVMYHMGVYMVLVISNGISNEPQKKKNAGYVKYSKQMMMGSEEGKILFPSNSHSSLNFLCTLLNSSHISDKICKCKKLFFGGIFLRCWYKSADKLWTKFQYPAKWYVRESKQTFFLHFSHISRRFVILFRIEFAWKPCDDEAIFTVNATNINFLSYGRLICEIRIVLLLEQWITVGSTYNLFGSESVSHW